VSIRRSAIAGDAITPLQRRALQDPRLSFRALGVLCAVLSRPADWRTSAEQLATERKEGREAIAAALRELEAAGYLARHRVQGERGHWAWVWDLTDDPAAMPVLPQVAAANGKAAGQTEDGFPGVGSPTVGGPTVGQPTVGKLGVKQEVQETGSRDIYAGQPPAAPALIDPPVSEAGPTFAEFYAAYPRHADRKRAETKWRQVTRGRPGLARQIIAAAARYAADPNLPEESLRPYAASWLSRELWNDGPCPGPAKPTRAVDPTDSLVAQARTSGVVFRR